MVLVGVELETLVFEPDAQTTRPPPSSTFWHGELRLLFNHFFGIIEDL